MKSRNLYFLCGVICGLSLTCGQSSAFAESGQDGRLRTVNYDPDRVVPLPIEEGYAVQVVLSPSEHIEAAGTGDNSHCDDPNAHWCVVARKGAHDIYINVHADAPATNLFIKTDKHDYSFDLLPVQKRAGRSHKIYRLKFDYPSDDNALVRAELIRELRLAKLIDQKKVLDTRMNHPNPPKNWDYTMQVMPGSDEIAPKMMYDDGRFTYLKFPNNREIPAIFMVSDDNTESVVQYHVEDDLIVVHRVAKRFVLRDGSAVVGLWNDAYDPDGVPPHDGVTVDGVKRTVLVVPRTAVGSVMPTRAIHGASVPNAGAARPGEAPLAVKSDQASVSAAASAVHAASPVLPDGGSAMSHQKANENDPPRVK